MEETLKFAKSELVKYFNMVGLNDFTDIDLRCYIKNNSTEINDFKFISEKWDDAYVIDIEKSKGSITGINPRSVLYGVYELLYYLGFRFLRPGVEGEIVPGEVNREITLKITKKADNRHRGICIEGAVSIEHVMEMIDWAPKMGFNSYFIQFFEGHTFFERWYKHEGSRVLSADEYTREMSQAFIPIIVAEIKKRGMIYHSVGHGWTCESIGYPSVGWDVVDNKMIPDEVKKCLALINGEREFFGGIPLNTNLCYSQKSIKEKLINQMIFYINNNRQVDVLHIWLADNFNNFCECEKCEIMSPSDHYVELLNMLDENLTTLGSDIKIAFLIYYELLWIPKTKRIKNPDRFIMMFAPITRTYTNPYLDNKDILEIKNMEPESFSLNEIKCPSDIESNLKFLFDWQEIFKGDSFVFDYHMMWDLYRDYSNMSLSKIIYKDMKALKSLGLNGNISCQVQRSFFPNGICMYIMGKTLFDTSLNYDEMVDEYFEASYGEFAKTVKNYLYEISILVPHKYMRHETEMVNTEISKSFKKSIETVKKYKSEFKESFEKLDNNQKAMMSIIIKSTEIFEVLFNLFYMKAKGIEKEKIIALWIKFSLELDKIELELSNVIDMYHFKLITERLLNIEW